MWTNELPETNDEACAMWTGGSIRDFSTEEIIAELRRRREEAAKIARLVREAELDYDGGE